LFDRDGYLKRSVLEKLGSEIHERLNEIGQLYSFCFISRAADKTNEIKIPLLMAAFGLLSALSAQAANIKISSLPFAITAPGTYVVTGNLTFAATTNVAAITISTAIQGPVIVDLKGFTLTGGAGDSIGVGIGVFAGTMDRTPTRSPLEMDHS
jgi:hypothetical protein